LQDKQNYLIFRFVIRVFDQLNEPRRTGGDEVVIKIVDPNQRDGYRFYNFLKSFCYYKIDAFLKLLIVIFATQDTHVGTYNVVWTPTIEGLHTISVKIKETDIKVTLFSKF